MMNDVLTRVVNDVAAKGPAVLLPSNVRFRRPLDVVNLHSLSAHDKRAILAAWASDLYAIESKPALRRIPGTPVPVTIDEVQAALGELDRRYGI
ncbi:hypothetical protein A6U87_05860 [Rhizobium sp. AC44/96]|uniref:hypothetical protein n=1 Tax=unclassified Rhizobium TaxID=2613769 RepID=UPI00080FCFA4|nr:MULTISPECIES: hypothetical protein [unclassified Rhizobium]MDM9623304.1 hypothetical protein [Rhizobium sp. S96]OCJ12838.1 hypothetical protein A6U87_05860 [Rhizobium sp. AC44/96]